jgi:hypothetical protein
MSCERYDRDLALYVEGDLPEPESSSVARHLEGCARCRDFLGALVTSQHAVKNLAAEPLDVIALESVRELVLASVGKTRVAPARAMPAWGWTLAASLAVVVGMAGLAWWARPAVHKEAVARNAAGLSRAVGAAPESSLNGESAMDVPVRDRAPEPTRRSTARATRVVSHDRERIGSAALSPEEADQLARAVVAMSRIRSLSELERPTGTRRLASGLAVLTTADPSVVIYWQLDSNGG